MSDERPKFLRTHPIRDLVIVGVLLTVLCCLTGPASSGNYRTGSEGRSAWLANKLSTAFYLYATDHAGRFPTGPTSTLVFQQLFDERYLKKDSDLEIHFWKRDQFMFDDKLDPKSVFWDVTQCAERPLTTTTDDPSDLPLILSTGFGPIKFQSGVNAMTITNPQLNPWKLDGVSVAYLDQSCRFIFSSDYRHEHQSSVQDFYDYWFPPSSQPAKLNLTDVPFTVPPNTTYHTVTP